MPRYWIVICPEPHVQGGVWQRWYTEGCVAVGWPPPEYSLDGLTDSAGWKWTRERLKQIQVGDKVIPFLLRWRIGPVGTVTEVRVADHEWNPTVEAGKYALNPNVPELGRRILVNWEREGMPPEGRVGVVPLSLRPKKALALHAMEELSKEDFDRLAPILSDTSNWEEILRQEIIPASVISSEDREAVDLAGLSVLERDLQKFLTRNLHTVEPGLRANPEYQLEGLITDVGILDLLCQDAYGNWVVIELKAGRADDAAIGQILGYMGWVRENLPNGEKARGMIICKEASPRVKAAAKMIPDFSIKRFQFSFIVESID